tara:strand:+ start:612 stop:890 length:279 start_codon:yes stop_codon:yes gene_type:complete
MYDITCAKNILIDVSKEFYLYLFWVIIQHYTPQVYANYCSGTIYNTLIMSQGIHCKSLRWMINASGDSITAMFYIFGLWFVKKLPIIMYNKT